MIVSALVLRKMRNVSDESCRQNQNTYLMLNTYFFRKLYRVRDNVEKCGTDRRASVDNTIWRMRFAFW